MGGVEAHPHRFELPHGSVVPVELVWTMEDPLDEAVPLVFVHLVDEEGTVRRTFDHAFSGSWQPGRTRSETVAVYHSVIGPALPSGEYELVVGLSDGGDRRWPLRAEGPDVGRKEYSLGRVEVPELVVDGPRFTFDDGWLPVEAGTDVQVVARRWLADTGTLEISGLPQDARELWMILRIPGETEGLRLVLEEGADQPTLRVTTDCSGFEAEVSGPGAHEIRAPVNWGGDSCRVRFDPSFHLIELASLRRVSAGLEQLAYR